MTVPTKNPIPSGNILDQIFNGEKIDEVVNSDNETYTDRFGVKRKTIAGLWSLVNAWFNGLIKYDGQLLLGSPQSIDELKLISGTSGVKINILGAFASGDGGAGTWVYDTSDLSGSVTSYPKLFIPPNTDPTGEKGAWKLSPNGSDYLTIQYGVSIGDKTHNTETLNQLMDYNKSVYNIKLPPTIVQVTKLYSKYNPKLVGVPGVNSELSSLRVMGSLNNGSALVSRDIDSADPLLTVAGTSSARLSGVDISDLAIISGDLIDNRDLTTNAEWQVRSSRTGLRLDYIASKVKISNLTVCGFKKAHYFNEVWDGTIRDSAISICSDSDGTVPAIFLGSESADNTNNLTYDNVRIEHCPYSVYIGAVNHVRFVACKVETKRKDNATNFVISVDSSAINYTFLACMFVTTPVTEKHYLDERGQKGIWLGNHFTIGGITGLFPGVRWIKRLPTNTSHANFAFNDFKGCWQADGTDATLYPIYLAPGDQFVGGVVSTQDVYSINNAGTYNNFSPTNQGLISVEDSTRVNNVTFETNNNTKVLGSVFYARNAGYNISNNTYTGAPYSLLTGNAIDSRTRVSSSGGIIDVFDKNTVILSDVTKTITGFTGTTGSEFGVFAYAAGGIIKNNSMIVTTGGADITMEMNKFYKFKLINKTTAVQI